MSDRARRFVVRTIVALAVVIGSVGQIVLCGVSALTLEARGEPSPAARGTGHDALWLGHAWVDGRRSQSDVDTLAIRLRGTGIRDLFVHTGPFNDDGTLDPTLRPQARWAISALHAALPGVRVQAWLGAHPVPEHLQLEEPGTRARLVAAVAEVLDDGFDGVHYDFEPVGDGDERLLTILRETRPLTRARHALLSVSAVRSEPWPHVAAAAGAVLPVTLSLWSGAYLHRVALEVDQVAVMAYDSALPTAAAYAGYVRRTTTAALAAVPSDVALLIGVPAYDDDNLYHHPRAESVAVAVRGVRLGLGDAPPPGRDFGIAVYVDFTATEEDWSAYGHDWS